MEQFNLAEQMQKRFEQSNQEKLKLQQQIKQIDEKITRLFKIGPKRPPVSLDKITEEMEALEFQRSTTSMSLTNEKQILKQMEQLKSKKQQWKEYQQVQDQIEQYRMEKSECISQQKKMEEIHYDLQQGLKKLQLAEKCQCQVNELTTQDCPLPENKAGTIIGKNGTNLKQLEQQYTVAMDVNRMGSIVTLTGTKENVARAKAYITEIVSITEETIGLHPDALNVLLNCKGRYIQQLIDQVENVYIDVNRTDGTAVLKGTPDKIEQLKKDIDALTHGKIDMEITNRLIPIVIGKKGQTINNLMQETGAVIEIDRDLNQLHLRGTKQMVVHAKQLIQELFDENEEFTKEYPLESHYVNFLLEDKGHEMKQLTQQLSIRYDIRRDTKLLATFIVKANQKQLNEFDTRLLAHMEQYNEEKILRLPLENEYVVSAIIGKNGDTIKQLSHDNQVKIDLNKEKLEVIVRKDENQLYESVITEIEAIIEKNRRFVIQCSNEVIQALLSKGNSSQIQKEIEPCQLLILRKDNEVVLIGTNDHIQTGKKVIFQFILNHLCETIDVDADEITHLIGPNGQTIQKIQQETSTTLQVDKANSSVTIQGSKDAIEEAKAKIASILQEHENVQDNFKNCLIKDIDQDAIAIIIGKQGSTITKLRDQYHVSLDLYKQRGKIRIKGEIDAVNQCQAAIFKLLNETMVNETITYPIGSAVDSLLLLELEAKTGIKISHNTKTRSFYLKGPIGKMGFVKRTILHVIQQNKYKVELVYPELYMDCFTNQGQDNIQRTREQCRVQITMDTMKHEVTIKGISYERVIQARDQMEQILQFFYPTHFKVLDSTIPPTFLSKLYSIVQEYPDIHMSVNLFSMKVKLFSSNETLLTQVIQEIDAKLQQHHKEYLEMMIPIDMIPSFVGKKGVHINELSKDTNTQISIDSLNGKLCIQGQEENLKQVKATIETQLAQYQAENRTIAVNSDDISVLIGKKGETIRLLQEEYETKINIMKDQYDSENDTIPVRLYGTNPDKLNAVEVKIKELLKAHGDKLVIEHVHPADLKLIIGKNGETIRHLQDTYHIKIDIDRINGNKVILRGELEAIQQGKQDITALLAKHAQERAMTPPPVAPEPKAPKVSTPSVSYPPPITKSMTKNQRRRARKRLENQNKEMDMVSMLMGQQPVPATATYPVVQSNVETMLCTTSKTPTIQEENNKSYYHSTSGYTLRL